MHPAGVNATALLPSRGSSREMGHRGPFCSAVFPCHTWLQKQGRPCLCLWWPARCWQEAWLVKYDTFPGVGERAPHLGGGGLKKSHKYPEMRSLLAVKMNDVAPSALDLLSCPWARLALSSPMERAPIGLLLNLYTCNIPWAVSSTAGACDGPKSRSWNKLGESNSY